MRFSAFLTAAVALVIALPGFAGDASSRSDGAGILPAAQIAEFSKTVETKLAEAGARVAILARSGRPRSELPPDVRYTHVAFAVYSMIELQDGTQQPGYAIYNLYQQAEAPGRSKLVQDYPYDFFAAVPELRAGIVVPTPQLQKRLLELITGDGYKRLHNPVYSLIANPFNNQAQNCTEFILNVVQASIYRTNNISFIKRTLSEYYSPYQVQINPLKLAAGAMFVEGISLSDHPGSVQTTTFGSLVEYLDQFDLVHRIIELDRTDVI